MLQYEIYETDIGKILIACDGLGITRLTTDLTADGMRRGETPLLREAADCLRAYLAGEGNALSGLPLSPQGTEFQKRVWLELCAIPYGETRSYKQIAQAIAKPTATRAVGGANGKNNILIAIPCHRVIGANGSLTGFGAGIELKKKLLDIESNGVWRNERR